MVGANASSQGQLQLLGLGDALRGDIARPAQGQERMSLRCVGSEEKNKPFSYLRYMELG